MSLTKPENDLFLSSLLIILAIVFAILLLLWVWVDHIVILKALSIDILLIILVAFLIRLNLK